MGCTDGFDSSQRWYRLKTHWRYMKLPESSLQVTQNRVTTDFKQWCAAADAACRKQQPEASADSSSVVALCSLSTNNNNLESIVAAAISTVLTKHTALIWKYTFLLLLLLSYEIFFLPARSILRYNVNNCASLSFAPHCRITP